MSARIALVVPLLVLTVLALAPSAGAARQPRLFHDTFSSAYRSPAGAVPTGSDVRLRLRVTGGKVKNVALRVEAGDPVTDTSTLRTLKMKRSGSFWVTTYRTPATPSLVAYAFRVTTARGVLWYGDDDSATDSRRGGTGKTTRSSHDAFKITVYARGFTTPAWLQGAVVYEIFPDRFRNGHPTNDYCRAGSTTGCPIFYGGTQSTLHLTWNEAMEDSRATGVFNRDFFGGDLEGITEKLDYLKSLGVDAIWLTPIFKARSNHRYDTDNYLEVDRALGGNESFAALSASAKARGIRLILDGVFNHTSSDSRYFDRYHRYPEVGACESPISPFRSWYKIGGSDVPCTSYSSFANLDSLPQLDHSSPAVRDFIYRRSDSVVRHWDARGADGWRLDAVQEMNHAWWTDFRSAVKSYAPDNPLIGEVTASPVDASPYLTGTELDGVMNYRFRQAAIGFARTLLFADQSGAIRPLTGTQLDHALKAILEDYPRQAAAVSFNLVDSHDTNRVGFALIEPGDPEAARQRQQLVALLQFTSFGAPTVYYGDETGFAVAGKNGFSDPYNRAPFPWTDEARDPRTGYLADPRMGDYYARLAAIRHSLRALRTGSLTTLLTSANIYAFARVAPPDKPVVVVLNKSARPTQLDIPVRGLYPNGTTLRDQKSSFQTTVANGRAHVELFQRDGVILVGTS